MEYNLRTFYFILGLETWFEDLEMSIYCFFLDRSQDLHRKAGICLDLDLNPKEKFENNPSLDLGKLDLDLVLIVVIFPVIKHNFKGYAKLQNTHYF